MSFEPGSGFLTMLLAGQWLGIDLGSRRTKVASFCLVSSDGSGTVSVDFERGSAGPDYPSINTRESLLDLDRSPTYLRTEVESAVAKVLDGSALVRNWLAAEDRRAVGIDAPVALARSHPGSTNRGRATEKASSPTFLTPDRTLFEEQLRTKGDPFLRVNCFWKCIGFAIYRHLGARIVGREGSGENPELAEIAAWTATAPITPPIEVHEGPEPRRPKIRETFPSDVYKRANGKDGVLAPAPRSVLAHLVAAGTEWRAAGEGRNRPTTSMLRRLHGVRDELRTALEEGSDDVGLAPMHKRPGTVGDLWDAFTCAFTACCEDHGGAVRHGGEECPGRLGEPAEASLLAEEGAILTVRCRPSR